MQVDYALILSAGLGTRMGEIGKIIPKVMWPILDFKLIDLQIAYCRDLGIKKIYINTHYLAATIEDHIKNNYGDEIILLHEDPLLDSGGAIHNLAMRNEVSYKGNLLTVNGDQFLLFSKTYFEEALSKLKNARAILFGIEVDKAEAYNETVLENGKLVEIRKNAGLSNYVTFSGLGLIKLDGLKPEKGATKFFQTVANFKTERVEMLVPSQMEYWDFGTAPIFYRSIKNLFECLGKGTKFELFLKAHNVDFSRFPSFFSSTKKSIDLEMKSRFIEESLSFQEIRQKL